MTTSTKSLLGVKKVIGTITKVFLLILLVLTTCTCSGLKLTWGTQTLGSPIDYSIYSGKLARQITDATECATLRTDVLGSHLWPHQIQLTRLRYHETLGLEYYLNRELMLKRCLPIRLYQYRLIIPSSLNRYKTGWNVQRRSYHTRYPQRDLRVIPSRKRPKIYRRALTPRSTGRIRGTTRTMERNSSSSSTMNRVNGRDRTTSSTTGGLRKQR